MYEYGTRAALAHINSLLTLMGGAALVLCGSGLVAGEMPAGWVALLPYGAAPALLLLSQLAVSGLHGSPNAARVMLVTYSVGCFLTLAVAGSVAAYAGVTVVNWLQDNDNGEAKRLLTSDPELRAWLRPLLTFAPDLLAMLPEESIRADVVLWLSACVLTLLSLPVVGGLALCVRPRRRRDTDSARRCSSVLYEPSAPYNMNAQLANAPSTPAPLVAPFAEPLAVYKTPLDDPSAWH